MEKVSFIFADRATVPGFIGAGVQTELIQHLVQMNADKLLVVTDDHVDALHGNYFDLLSDRSQSQITAPGEEGLGNVGVSPILEKKVLPAGDAAKSWDHLSELMKWNFKVGASKKSVVVAFGGGALLNVCGLFASMAYRGMKLVYVPTTLLAMHDVVTSLKTSICFDGRKNNIGSFYAPAKILIDVSFCETLPKTELFSGLGELAKNAALFGGAHAEGFVAALTKESVDANHGGSGGEFIIDGETLKTLVHLGIEAKMTILANDAYEKTSGMIFEYGHTVSHAIEKAYGDGIIPHGLGVVYGMLSSSYVAEKLGITTKADRQEHDDLCNMLLKRWSLPEPKPSVELVMSLAMKDSKRGITSESADEISDVLLYNLGNVVPTKTQMLSKFPSALVCEWLESMGFPCDKAFPRKDEIAPLPIMTRAPSFPDERKMRSMPFVFADRATVPGFIGKNVQEEIHEHLLEFGADKILVVTEENVNLLYSDYFAVFHEEQRTQMTRSVVAAPGEMPDSCAAPFPQLEKIVLPSGDAAKSWDNLSRLINWNFSVGASKKTVVVAFGGGALLNVAGLFSSIAFRGTKVVYVPTTLLAMHDVVTSLKTSICFDGRKNNIGSFYAPAKILIDVAFCNTLPKDELFSGLGELAKNAALFGGSHAQGFADALSKDSVDTRNGGSGEEFTLDEATLERLVHLGIQAKMAVLATDAYEKTSGMIFEYGHTVSHAIEKAYGDGTIPHGLGVVYGMLSSSYAAEKMGVMTKEAQKEHDELCHMLLRKWPLPEPKPPLELVMSLAMKDSKRGITAENDDEISDVLLHKMGDVVPTETQMLSKFACNLIAEWLESMGFTSEHDSCQEASKSFQAHSMHEDESSGCIGGSF